MGPSKREISSAGTGSAAAAAVAVAESKQTKPRSGGSAGRSKSKAASSKVAPTSSGSSGQSVRVFRKLVQEKQKAQALWYHTFVEPDTKRYRYWLIAVMLAIVSD